MIGRSFNYGWRVRRRMGVFGQLPGRDTGYEDVTLPHDAQLRRGREADLDGATAFFRSGAFEYERRLDVPGDWTDRRVMLRFEGVYRDATVVLNGDAIENRPYGYSEFSVRLDDRLVPGTENVLRVECRTSRTDSRWYSGAGIYRDVTLFVGHQIHVALDGVRVTTPHVESDSATVAVEAQIENDSGRRAAVRVRTEIIGADGLMCASDDQPVSLTAVGSTAMRALVVVPRPVLWDLEHPDLYTCRVVVSRGDDVLDEASTSFGIRTVTVDAQRGLRLNGETIKLRGACVHHDNGVIGAATIGRADERRVELLKAAGFNAIRSAHQPMSRSMLDACDRHGVLVMDEAFDMWQLPKRDDDYSTHFPAWWRRDVEAMVVKDRNHPSVIMYSIGNEIPEIGSTAGGVLSREMADHVRGLDPTRLVTNGVNLLFAAVHAVGWEPDTLLNAAMGGDVDVVGSEQVGTATEEAFSALDVAGYNYAVVRYEPDGKRFPNRVIVGTETFPSEIDRYWQTVLDNDHVIGDFTWTGWDYLGEVGVGRIVYDTDDTADDTGEFTAAYPWRYAWCGDIDVIGDRLPVSYYRETVFGVRSEPYIAVLPPRHHRAERVYGTQWSWSTAIGSWTWDGDEGRETEIEVYADADEVELWQDGRSLGRQPAGRQHRFIARYVTTYGPGELACAAYRSGVEVGRSTLRTATSEVQLHLDIDRADLAADDRDLAFVAVSVLDASGTLHTSADREVRVAVEGVGILQGLGTAAPASTESFTDDRCTTFRGRALAVVRPTRPGSITVTAESDGLPRSTATITASTRPDSAVAVRGAFTG